MDCKDIPHMHSLFEILLNFENDEMLQKRYYEVYNIRKTPIEQCRERCKGKKLNLQKNVLGQLFFNTLLKN